MGTIFLYRLKRDEKPVFPQDASLAKRILPHKRDMSTCVCRWLLANNYTPCAGVKPQPSQDFTDAATRTRFGVSRFRANLISASSPAMRHLSSSWREGWNFDMRLSFFAC